MLKDLVPRQELGRTWIEGRLPHAGAMLLIDRVSTWSPHAIDCRTASHRLADNPLRAENRLGALAGVEYAAQAMAIHAALLHCENAAQAPSRTQGYLAALRDIQLDVDRLDTFPQELAIWAQLLAAMDGGASYSYCISHGDDTLQCGRLTLRFSVTGTGQPGIAA